MTARSVRDLVDAGRTLFATESFDSERVQRAVSTVRGA